LRHLDNKTAKNTGKIILITGGVRSGKSLFAENLAASLGPKVLYLATSEVKDQEMAARVKSHQDRRPASWRTIEEPVKINDVIVAVGQEYQVVLIDCLTLFISNLMEYHGIMYDLESSKVTAQPEKEKAIAKEIEELCRIAKKIDTTTIIVTNEVGWGVVPPYPLGRLFRDITGKCNQIAANYADEAYLLVTGLPIKIK
jgi:adenosylcobinamide kinase/adenosylcobinamide-phosphate guanylyltransferase